MALQFLAFAPLCSLTKVAMPLRRQVTTRVSSSKTFVTSHVLCTQITDSTTGRRSGNYQPCIWDYDYVQSLRSDYVGDKYKERASQLIRNVRAMFEHTNEPLAQLELIDVLRRLGLSYHFEEEITRTLGTLYITSCNSDWKNKDLHATALSFRLLRQHGYKVSQEVFKSFMDSLGNFKELLGDDTKGMLSLYEASFLGLEDENILDNARNFSSMHLRDLKKNSDPNLGIQVEHALELPLHWRIPRIETRWFIGMYERGVDMNPVLLELAKLDFNMIQAEYQEEIKEMSRWWTSLGLANKLSFARDRLVTNYLWCVGTIFEPQYGDARKILTIVNVFITTLDDVYDVYGTLEELELFTTTFERWDISMIEQLPDYMKLCFLAVYNSTNEIAYDVLKKHGLNIVSFLQKLWVDLCKAYLVEARWYYSGYKPTLEEYLNNAWLSISGPVILLPAYFYVTKTIKKEVLNCVKSYPDIIRWSSIILRLADDLGTSTYELERGDVPKSIQCYMYETGASEQVAREHIKGLISEMWKKMNEDGAADPLFSSTFIGMAENLARMAQCAYQHGDGFAVEDRETKDHILTLLAHPV